MTSVIKKIALMEGVKLMKEFQSRTYMCIVVIYGSSKRILVVIRKTMTLFKIIYFILHISVL